MNEIVYLSFVTASISFTVTETKIFRPLREWIEIRWPKIGKLVGCGYCFGHWVAFALVAVYQPRLFKAWWLLDYFTTAIVVAWLAGFQWAIMCWLMQKTQK